MRGMHKPLGLNFQACIYQQIYTKPYVNSSKIAKNNCLIHKFTPKFLTNNKRNRKF